MPTTTTLLYPYCTLAEVQAECSNVDPDDVESFKIAINLASRWIDRYCRRDFKYHDHSSTALEVSPTWIADNVIYVPWPVLTLTAVSVSDRVNAAIALDSTDYFVEPNRLSATGKIVRAGRWQSRDVFGQGPAPSRLSPFPVKILLTGTFGYAPVMTTDLVPVADTAVPSASLPADLQRAAAVLAGIFSGKSRKEFVGAGGDRQSVAVRTPPKDVLEMLCAYRVDLV